MHWWVGFMNKYYRQKANRENREPTRGSRREGHAGRAKRKPRKERLRREQIPKTGRKEGRETAGGENQQRQATQGKGIIMHYYAPFTSENLPIRPEKVCLSYLNLKFLSKPCLIDPVKEQQKTAKYAINGSQNTRWILKNPDRIRMKNIKKSRGKPWTTWLIILK